MARVAIVIVTYNSAAEIGACLDALAGLAEGDAEILVVDNASSDPTREVLARNIESNVKLIANRTNAGFAAALNQGVRATEAPLILSLNPDAHLVRGLDAMAACMEKPGTGAVGGQLIGKDGKPQTGFMARNLPTPGGAGIRSIGHQSALAGQPRELALPLLRLRPNDSGARRSTGWCVPDVLPRQLGSSWRFRRAVLADLVRGCRLLCEDQGRRILYVLPPWGRRKTFRFSCSPANWLWRIVKDIGMVVFLSMPPGTFVRLHSERSARL